MQPAPGALSRRQLIDRLAKVGAGALATAMGGGAVIDAIAHADEIRQVAVLAITTAGFPTTIAALSWVDEVLAANP